MIERLEEQCGTDFERRSRTQEDKLKRSLFSSYAARRTLVESSEKLSFQVGSSADS